MALIPRRGPRSARRPLRLRSDTPDAEVIARSLAHPEAFELVFERHHASVWRFLARVAGPTHADDLAGDVFVTAFASRDRYDPDRGSVRAWLYGIAANVARTRLRSADRGERAHERWGRATATVEHPIADLEDGWLVRQRSIDATAAIAALPPTDREVLVLLACDELTYEQIAATLGISLGTVKSRIARARGRMRELFPDIGQDLSEPARASDAPD